MQTIFFILSLIFLKLLIVGVAFFLGHPGLKYVALIRDGFTWRRDHDIRNVVELVRSEPYGKSVLNVNCIVLYCMISEQARLGLAY